MTRTRLASPSLPLFLLAAAVVALLAFGLTRYVVDARSTTLPSLEVAADAAAAAPGALDPAKLFAARVDTTVSIEATIEGSPMNGSGVVVDTDGTIVTASHVIHDYTRAARASTIIVRFRKGDEVPARLVAIDMFNDLAILKIDPSAVQGLVAAPIATDSDALVVGAPVAAIGAPYGYEFTQTVGNVSAVHRVIESRINGAWKIPDAIQFDAAINTGNSGGPLFNARGEVIGIAQQIASKSETNSGVSFAVSSNLVRRAMDIHERTGATSIPYASLGLETESVSPQLARVGKLAATRGAVVQQAVGPAALAGLAKGRTIEFNGRPVVLGSVIVELAGRPINSSDDLRRVAALIDATKPVSITYLQGDRRVETTITPVAQPIV